jgi:hypothetical protein
MLTVLARLTLLPYFRGSVVLHTLEHSRTNQICPYASGSQSVGRAPLGGGARDPQGGARGAKLFYSLKINKKLKHN